MDHSWLQQPGRKTIGVIALEASACALREREVPYYYFSHALFHPASGDYRRYVGHRTTWRLIREAHVLNPLLKNKLLLEALLREAGVPGPPATLLSVRNGHYYDHTTSRELAKISVEDLRGRIHAALASCKGVFVKRTSAQAGSDAVLIRQDLTGLGLNSSSVTSIECIEDLHNRLATGEWIIAPQVEQHTDLARVYPVSVNTLRLVTWKKSHTRIEVIAALMRFGDLGSVTDNRKSGGLCVPVEIEGGALKGHGFKNSRFRPMVHDRHPHTLERFLGLRCPGFDEARRVCQSAHHLIDNPIVGWDVAICPESVRILEGNGNPDVTLTQLAIGGLRSSSASEAYARWL